MSKLKRFLKPILRATLREGKLELPDKFVMKHRDELFNSVRLMNPAGDIWHVKLEKIDNTIWLHEGLHKFIMDHSIEEKYSLNFKYYGNSTFEVHIYDLSTCEVEYSKNSDSSRPKNINWQPTSDKKVKIEDEEDDDTSIEILSSSRDHESFTEIASGSRKSNTASAERSKPGRGYLTRIKRHKIQDNQGIQAKGVHESSDEALLASSSEADKKIASSANKKNSSRKCKSIGSKSSCKDSSEKKGKQVQVKRETQAGNVSSPNGPCHSVTLKHYHISKSLIVPLPYEFTRFYISTTTKFIKLLDSDDNEWEVLCNVESKTTSRLSKGWSVFVRDKKLMVGDVCVFEPVRSNGEVKLKVTVSRAANAN